MTDESKTVDAFEPTDDGNELEKVYSAANEIEAKIVVNALSTACIESLMQGQHSASFRAEVPSDVKVVVRKQDVAAAREILEKLDLDGEIDWDQVDVGEPID